MLFRKIQNRCLEEARLYTARCRSAMNNVTKIIRTTFTGMDSSPICIEAGPLPPSFCLKITHFLMYPRPSGGDTNAYSQVFQTSGQ